jgi:hypothetical protein
MRHYLGLLLGLLLSISFPAEACEGHAPIVSVVQGTSLEARAQTGVRLTGVYGHPKIVGVRQVDGTPPVALDIKTKVTDLRDNRSMWRRILGGAPELVAIPAPNQVLLKPAKILDADLEYEVTVRDGEEQRALRIRFKGGLQKC